MPLFLEDLKMMINLFCQESFFICCFFEKCGASSFFCCSLAKRIDRMRHVFGHLTNHFNPNKRAHFQKMTEANHKKVLVNICKKKSFLNFAMSFFTTCKVFHGFVDAEEVSCKPIKKLNRHKGLTETCESVNISWNAD